MTQVTLNNGSVDSAGALALKTNGTTTAVTVDTSQNVGIGTSSPQQKLDVTGGYLQLRDSTGSGGYRLTIGADLTSCRLNSVDNTPLTFSMGGSEKARIDTSGNLLVGTTTALAKNYTVQSANSNGLGVETTGSGFTSNAFQTGVYGTAAGAGFNHIACKNSSAANIFAVRGDGFIYTPNLGAATGTAVVLNANGFLYTLSSSGRYKKDVTPIDIGLDFILGLNPVKYNLIETNEPQVGFIAEDFPDSRLVSMSKVDKQDDSKGLQAESVNYAQIVAPLVKAIQEQQALISSQAAAITSLTERITALEAK